MNKVSGEIGLERTNFASVHGLANWKNISTARDMAILGAEVMNTASDIVGCKSYKANIINAGE